MIDSEYVVRYSTVSANMDAKYLTPCIVTAQVQDLQQLIGTPLSTSLAEKVDDESIDAEGNELYKELLDEYVKPFLLAATQSELLISNAVKLRNSGNMQYLDTNQTNMSMKDVEYLVQHYRDQAAFLGNRVTEYLKCHRTAFPELKACGCCNDLRPDAKAEIKIPLYL